MRPLDYFGWLFGGGLACLVVFTVLFELGGGYMCTGTIIGAPVTSLVLFGMLHFAFKRRGRGLSDIGPKFFLATLISGAIMECWLGDGFSPDVAKTAAVITLLVMCCAVVMERLDQHRGQRHQSRAIS